MDFGGGEYAPKIHSPLEDPETSTDIQRYAQVHSRNHSYGGTSIGTEARWSRRRDGIPHEWPHGMQGTALHVNSYIYTSFTQYEI